MLASKCKNLSVFIWVCAFIRGKIRGHCSYLNVPKLFLQCHPVEKWAKKALYIFRICSDRSSSTSSYCCHFFDGHCRFICPGPCVSQRAKRNNECCHINSDEKHKLVPFVPHAVCLIIESQTKTYYTWS